MKTVIKYLWIKYYTALWCVRCYVWNPFVHAVERAFEAADYKVRIRVAKYLDADSWIKGTRYTKD